jgi:hypothetical protein
MNPAGEKVLKDGTKLTPEQSLEQDMLTYI